MGSFIAVVIFAFAIVLEEIRSAEIQPNHSVGLIHHKGIAKCSGSFIDNRTVITATSCIGKMHANDIRVKLHDGSRFRVMRRITFYDGAVTVLELFDSTSARNSIKFVPLVGESDEINDSPNLVGWYEVQLNESHAFELGSFELSNKIEESKCSGQLKGIKIVKDDICMGMRSTNIKTPRLLPGAPVIRSDGVQVGIASAIDGENSLVLYTKINNYRGRIDQILRVRVLEEMPVHVTATKEWGQENSTNYTYIQYGDIIV